MHARGVGEKSVSARTWPASRWSRLVSTVRPADTRNVSVIRTPCARHRVSVFFSVWFISAFYIFFCFFVFLTELIRQKKKKRFYRTFFGTRPTPLFGRGSRFARERPPSLRPGQFSRRTSSVVLFSCARTPPTAKTIRLVSYGFQARRWESTLHFFLFFFFLSQVLRPNSLYLSYSSDFGR